MGTQQQAAITAFLVVPYARYYDLPILLPALFWLLAGPLPAAVRGGLTTAVIVVPPAAWWFGPAEPTLVQRDTEALARQVNGHEWPDQSCADDVHLLGGHIASPGFAVPPATASTRANLKTSA